MIIFASALLVTLFHRRPPFTPPRAADMINSVLRASAAEKRAGDTEASEDSFERVFDPILNTRNENTDHALAALLAFSLGESQDLECELVHRGGAMLSLLRAYRDRPFKTKERGRYRFDDAERKARYDRVIASITRGEKCARDR